MSYAIITLGGKQYTVREGERLLVDRLSHDEGKSFTPDVLLVGGDGGATLSPRDVTVTAKVLGPALGEKIRIGKYRPKKGYKRHTGFRAKLTQIEIESIGGKQSRRATKTKPEAVEATPAQAEETPKGLPAGYDDLTVADIKEQAGSWRRPQLEAALEYERAHAARKGAIAALESSLAEKEEG
jgi:large subunit ribosomal protein L21